MKKIFLITIFILTLSGCGITSGTVYARQYEPAHDEQRERPIYITQCYTVTRFNGKNSYPSQSCHQVWVGTDHYIEHIRSCWRLSFKNKSGDKGSQCVRKSIYSEKQIGTHYDEEKDK